MRVFIALATGQNVANFPPILHYANRGDLVIWLESEGMQRQGVARRACRVLQARGIASVVQKIADEDLYRPNRIADAMEQGLRQRAGKVDELFVVLNGGKKPTVAGLVLGKERWRKRSSGRAAWLLYGEDREPVVYRMSALGGNYAKEPYDNRRRMLSLEEILQISGYRLQNDKSSEAAGLAGLNVRQALEQHRTNWAQLAKALGDEAFGSNLDYTARVMDWAVRCEQAGLDREQQRLAWPAFDIWIKADQNKMADWLKRIVEREAGRTMRAEQARAVARSLVAQMRRSRFAPRVQAPERPPDEDWQAMGPRFELAVLRRVVRFLASHPQAAAVVRELAFQVALRREDDGDRGLSKAQWDVVIVKTNGVVLHLECKSGGVKRKDLLARQGELERSVSRLARMYVVAPFLGGFDQADWAGAHLRQWNDLCRAAGREMEVLAYTAANHPQEDELDHPEAGKVKVPPPFETMLGRILGVGSGGPAPAPTKVR